MTPRGLRGFLLGVSFLGFLAAFYLTLQHYRGGIPRCYMEDGCTLVQTSKYSALLGLPIALPGALFFATMFALGIALLTVPTRAVTLTYKILARAGALAAIPLFLLQAVVLHAYCTFCLATEVVLVTLWLASLALRASPRTAGAARGDETESDETESGEAESQSSTPRGRP
jgi:uncharacterized membrane protein